MQETQNILPPTLKTRSEPHWICSVAPGNDRQSVRSVSSVMADVVQDAPRGGEYHLREFQDYRARARRASASSGSSASASFHSAKKR